MVGAPLNDLQHKKFIPMWHFITRYFHCWGKFIPTQGLAISQLEKLVAKLDNHKP